jgi:hypothetical protein
LSPPQAESASILASNTAGHNGARHRNMPTFVFFSVIIHLHSTKFYAINTFANFSVVLHAQQQRSSMQPDP